jgi:hypothetical protein
MTIVDVVNRVSSLVAGDPYYYRIAKEPFGFDRQPQQRLDRTFCVQSGDPREIGGYIGYAQSEIVPVTIRLARLVQRDAVAAYRAMLTDVSSLQSTIAHDGVLGDYNADVEGWTLPEPQSDADYVIAELVVLTDYEREL